MLTEILPNVELFSISEKEKLDGLQSQFRKNISELSEFEINKEFERLALDLSWKSSQIEGRIVVL